MSHYTGPGTVQQALFMSPHLTDVRVGAGLIVGGLREPEQSAWGPAYTGDLPIPTSLVVRVTATGREYRWRPPGPPGFVFGIPTPYGIVITTSVPQVAAACGAATTDCETWAVGLLDIKTGRVRTLMRGGPADYQYRPQPLVQGSLVGFAAPRPGKHSDDIDVADLRTGQVRTIARVPFGSGDLSGSLTGTLWVLDVFGLAPTSGDVSTVDHAASIDTRTGRVQLLAGLWPNLKAGARGLAWVTNSPSGLTQLFVREFGNSQVVRLPDPALQVNYTVWVDPTTLLDVTTSGLDLYSDVFSAHPRRTDIDLQGGTAYPLPGIVSDGEGTFAFALQSAANYNLTDPVTYYVVKA